MNRNAEITSPRSLKNNTEIRIEELKEDAFENVDFQESDDNPSSVSSSEIVVTRTISYADIQQKKYTRQELFLQMKLWANEKKFNLVLKEGVIHLKSEKKVIFHCQIKNCPYRVIFKAKKQNNLFQIYSKLSSKYRLSGKSCK